MEKKAEEEVERREMDENKVEEAQKREERKKSEIKRKEQWIQTSRQKDKLHEGACSK